jgi:hypothetical protein
MATIEDAPCRAWAAKAILETPYRSDEAHELIQQIYEVIDGEDDESTAALLVRLQELAPYDPDTVFLRNLHLLQTSE